MFGKLLEMIFVRFHERITMNIISKKISLYLSLFFIISISTTGCFLFKKKEAETLSESSTEDISQYTETKESDHIDIIGDIYEIDGKDGGFQYSGTSISSEKTDKIKPYGNFYLSGNFVEIDQIDGYQAFDAKKDYSADQDGSNTFTFNYLYDDYLLNTDASSEWTLYSDGAKKVDEIALDNKVGNGCFVIQSSFDGKKWTTDSVVTNVFSEKPKSKGDETIFKVTDNQLINGCFYKITIAYEVYMDSGEKSSNPLADTHLYKEFAEVYKFYIIDSSENKKAAKPNTTPKFIFSPSFVLSGVDTGYSEKNDIPSDNVHFGWDIGEFYINGFSGNVQYENGDSKKQNPIFLKNVGDKVTLWFDLKQTDILNLNGSSNLSIVDDEKGSDQSLKVTAQNFKKGALIIKFTDYQNKSTTNIYTDYLSAASTTSADTKVQLFDEGDYEIALDYKIRDSKPVLDKYYGYRINFKFSIRNSNCMVYPIDLSNGSEMRDKSITETGFRLDTARSRYLDLITKRITLADNTLDLRVNEISSDLDEFTDEGIYEFTVRNKYTNETATKTIYVGTNNILKAYIKYSEKYSLADLNDMKEKGFEFTDDGSIIEPTTEAETFIETITPETIIETTVPLSAENYNSTSETTNSTVEETEETREEKEHFWSDWF